MGLIGLWTVAIAMLLAAVWYGWVAIKAQPASVRVAQRVRRRRNHDELVRLECADLDDEYRRLLKH